MEQNILNDIHCAGSEGSDVAILVVSCDSYQDLWHPFFHCFFKYWPDCPYPIYLGSNFLSYSDTRVRQIRIGLDVDYSSNLLAMLDHIDQPWVILWIEDLVVSVPVDTKRVVRLINLAQEQQVGYLKLIARHPFSTVEHPTQEFGEIPPGTRYRVGITIALWDKQVLLDILLPNETPWDIERRGSQRSNGFKKRFCALSSRIRNNPPISDMHLVRKGRLNRDAIEFLKHEDLLFFVSKRPIQTLLSYLYVKAYSVFWDLYSPLSLS